MRNRRENNALDRTEPTLGREARVVEVLGSAPPVRVALGVEAVGLPNAVRRALAVVVDPAVVGATKPSLVSPFEGHATKLCTHQERTRSALHVAA